MKFPANAEESTSEKQATWKPTGFGTDNRLWMVKPNVGEKLSVSGLSNTGSGEDNPRRGKTVDEELHRDINPKESKRVKRIYEKKFLVNVVSRQLRN